MTGPAGEVPRGFSGGAGGTAAVDGCAGAGVHGRGDPGWGRRRGDGVTGVDGSPGATADGGRCCSGSASRTGLRARVRAALDSARPRTVLIEGPPEADPLVPLAGDEEMRPPVALLAHAVDEPGRSAFWPLAEFSPEWWRSAGLWNTAFRPGSSTCPPRTRWHGRGGPGVPAGRDR